MFIVNCLLRNKYNIHIFSILFIHLSQHHKPNFHAKNIIWLKFTINYSLFKLNYNWRHCSATSLTVVMLCVCTKIVCVCNIELVCKAVRLAFSCRTSAISLPFIPIPWEREVKTTRPIRSSYKTQQGIKSAINILSREHSICVLKCTIYHAYTL